MSKILATTMEDLVNLWLEKEHPELAENIRYKMSVKRSSGVVTITIVE